MQRRISLLFTFILVASIACAQFQLNGSAISLGSNTYLLTPSQTNQSGSMWWVNKIDISKDFDLNFELFFGASDANGADGIMFVLQQVSTAAGGGGGGIGYAGITPSVAVEFDTYQNSQYGDPSYDHVALVSGGSVAHSGATSLVAPVQASASSQNIEDNAFHSVRVTWNSTTKTMNVYFDCTLRITYTGDIISNNFNNNSMVYWGFTAGTGGLYNDQMVKLSSVSFIKPQNQTICAGDTAQLNMSTSQKIRWTPFYNISDTTISNPKVWPAHKQWYVYSVSLSCNATSVDSVLVDVLPKLPISSALPPITYCLGQQYQIQTNLTGKIKWLPKTDVSNDTIGNPFIIKQLSGWLKVQATNACSVISDSLYVNVKQGSADIRDINVFTPDGDGYNETFELVDPAKAAGFASYRIRILDRWGLKMFESKDPLDSWNGKMKSENVAPGVYYFVLQYLDNCSGEEREKTGWIQVIY